MHSEGRSHLTEQTCWNEYIIFDDCLEYLTIIWTRVHDLTQNQFELVIVKLFLSIFRADCSAADKVGAIPEHNGLSPFGKVS